MSRIPKVLTVTGVRESLLPSRGERARSSASNITGLQCSL